jgi:hypothetical protein
MKTAPRRLRMALHAFPRRFRAARSAEILATFEEAEFAGDAHPYGVRALADVVVAGWGERLRTRPPMGAYLKYRLLDGRLDARWHRWMLDDVRGRWYGLRRAVFTWLIFAAVMLVFFQAGMAPPDMGFVVVYVVAVIVVAVLATPMHRRRTLRRHGYDPETLTWVPPDLWAATAPRPPRLVRVAPIAFTMAVALAAVAPFAVLASLGHIGAGSGSMTRNADGQLPATIAAVIVATLVGAAGSLGRRSISRRFTRTIPDGAQVDLVFSDLASAGTLSAAVTAVGLIACLAPITPLIVPLTFVVSAGAVPTLVLVGIDVQRHRPHGAVIVWTPRPSEADAARTS